MAHVDVSPDAVASIGSQVAAAGSGPATPTAAVSPPAQDPVSVGVAQTFAARVSAIAQYSAAADAITNSRAAMVNASAEAYRQQEQINQASLANGAGTPGGAAAPSMPAAAMPTLSTPTIAPPSIGAPPGSGRAIAELIHSGAGPDALFSAAQQMRRHAAELSAAASQLHGSANSLGQQWDSGAGQQAVSRVTELASWYDAHAQHATAAAAAMERHGENFGRARNVIPTPERFDDVQRRLQTAIAANQSPGSFGRYAPVIAQLQAELGKLNSEAIAHYGEYSAGAADPSVVGDPLQAPPRPGGDIQAVGFDVPLAPQGDEPPFGKDRRYWLDVGKIIHVPEGTLAPANTTQIGPELYYPTGPAHQPSPPPPPAKYPLDIGDIVATGPKQLGPSTHTVIAELPDGTTYWAPDPNLGYQPSPPWSAPQQPIDVRDIIHVPRESLAPTGYVEYLPEWWVRQPSSTPTVPRLPE